MNKCKIFLAIFIFFLTFFISIVSKLIKSRMINDDNEKLNKFYTNPYFIYFINSLVVCLVVFLVYDTIITKYITDCKCIINNTMILNGNFDQ